MSTLTPYQAVSIKRSILKTPTFGTQPMVKASSLNKTTALQPKFGMGWDSFAKRVERDINHALAPEMQRERYIQFNQGRYANADALHAAFSAYEEKVQESQMHLMAGGAAGGAIGGLLGHALDNLNIDDNSDTQSQKSDDSDDSPGLFTLIGSALGALGGAFAQHEVAEASGEDYGINEYDQAVAESVGHAGEMLAQRLATDPALQKGFERMLQVAQSGGLTEETLTAIADEYLQDEEKQVNPDGSLKFGARRDPAAKKHTLAVGALAFGSLANAIVAIPGYAFHGAELPAHMIITGIMKRSLNKIYNGPSDKDSLRSNIMNGPYGLLGTVGIDLTEHAASTAMRFATTATIPLHWGAGHVVLLPAHALLKGASAFLSGGVMIPAESSFGNALNEEEDRNPIAYKRTDSHANDYIENHKSWANNFYRGRKQTADNHWNAREKAAEQIKKADYAKLSGVPKWSFDRAILRDADDIKRKGLSYVSGGKDFILGLFTNSKENMKQYC